jgi:mRNA-degrading endonuclease HigB of HigAB toxin-antitoxin module
VIELERLPTTTIWSKTLTKRKKLVLGILLGAVVAGALAIVLLYFAYPSLEADYQRHMDPIRKSHARQIADLVREFADKTGHLPFQEHAAKKPFMVIIGHSPQEEDYFANDPVLKRGATWANANELEAVLSNGLKRTVCLPRDPQKVPTYAPNVYVYFVSGNEMSVVSHLCYPDDEMTIKYQWHGHTFYAYTLTYIFEPNR